MDVSSVLYECNDKLVNVERDSKMRGSRIPQRWVMAVMGCLGLTNALMMRTCLSIAITEMVKPTEQTVSNDSLSHDTCTGFEDTSATSSSGGTYEWDEYTQGIILSSFYWGYTITQIPGGILAEKFGGKHTLGLGVLSTAIFTFLTPKVVQVYGSTGLMVIRILMGLGEGSTYPAVSELIAQWAPVHERSRMFTLVASGVNLGTVIGNALSGVLIEKSSIGWPLAFYVFGATGTLWFIAWVFLCYSYPDDHPFISNKEKKYLKEMMKEHTHRLKKPTPWWHVLSSIPMWAMVVGNIGACWGFYAMISDLPKYMSNVLRFSVEANGFLSALPHVLMWIVGNASSWLADWMIEGNKMSRTNIRKTLSTLASALSATFLIAASYAGCDRTLVIILFVLGVGMMGLFFPSVIVNPNDLSPNYSGTLEAIANLTSSLAGIAAPYVVGLLTPNQALSEWRIVFWINFFILCTCALIFHMWADGEVQNWNDLDPQIEKIESKEIVPFMDSLVNTETIQNDSNSV